MKFSCEKSSILKEILLAHDTISTKSTISILSNVLLDVHDGLLHLNATDLKVAYKSQIPVQITNEGTVAVLCDRMLDILRSLPDGQISFELKDTVYLSIVPEKSSIQFQLKCIPPDKFPEQHGIADDLYMEFPQKEFVDMVSKTIFAISDDETRFFLNGVFLEKIENNLSMVASDGRRLALIKKGFPGQVNDFNGVIVPPKILHIIRKNASGEGNLLLAITEKNVFVKLDNHLFSSNLIEGKFPNYQKIIPEQHEYNVIVSKTSLLESLKRVSILVENKSRRVFIAIQGNTLTVSSEESEIGMAREELECEYSGPDISIAVNYLYLLEPIREIGTEKIMIEFTDNKKALTVKPSGNDDYFNIVMPLQKD
ncbi:MAG: DNA polymerase III subunit beta [Spirochaetia bacterium]